MTNFLIANNDKRLSPKNTNRVKRNGDSWLDDDCKWDKWICSHRVFPLNTMTSKYILRLLPGLVRRVISTHLGSRFTLAIPASYTIQNCQFCTSIVSNTITSMCNCLFNSFTITLTHGTKCFYIYNVIDFKCSICLNDNISYF